MDTAEIKVLLIDDNPDDVLIIRRLLGQYEHANFTMLSANSASTGLAVLEAEGADLVFLDYSMPEENGLSFLRRAGNILDLPPVIILTGSSNQLYIVEALRSGVSDYILKQTMTAKSLGQAAESALSRANHAIKLGSYDRKIVEALARSAANLEPSSPDGSRLPNLAVTLGGWMGLNLYQIENLYIGAMLHDVGKLGLSNEIIVNTGPLTVQEIEEIRMHPLIGERLCSSLRLSRELAPIIRHHHERWDGEGYVDGLKGTDIPLLARVISLVDAFDAMTANRPYRTAFTVEEALRRVESGAGAQWDPEIVAIFLARIGGHLGV